MKFILKLIPILVLFFVITGCDRTISPANDPQKPPSVDNDQQNLPNVEIDSGRYNGQIDSNSIEVIISGVPAEKGTQALRLSETIKAEFETYKLNTGDNIKFSYIINEYDQKVITKLEIIERALEDPLPPKRPAPNDPPANSPPTNLPPTDNPQTKSDTGRYVGQIDSNSIEIRISGVPVEYSAKAFKLGDMLKLNFHTYALQPNDEIKFTYISQKEGQPIILNLEKL